MTNRRWLFARNSAGNGKSGASGQPERGVNAPSGPARSLPGDAHNRAIFVDGASFVRGLTGPRGKDPFEGLRRPRSRRRAGAMVMSFPSPSFLRLPRASLVRRNVVSTLVRHRVDARGSVRAAITHAFAFKDDELLFARALLAIQSRLWLYRTNQRAFAGDFVVVDLSSPVVARRPVYALDLKRGEPVRVHEGTGV